MNSKIVNAVSLVCLGLVSVAPDVVLADTTGKVFAAGDGSGTIAVIDAHTNSVVSTINTGAGTQPHNFAVGPNNRYVWATLKGSGEVVQIDAVNNTLVNRFNTDTNISDTLLPNPVHLDISGDGNWLYVVNKAADQIVKMSTADGSFAGNYSFTPAVDFNPHDINISPDGNSLWVTDESQNGVMVIDTNNLSGGVSNSIGTGSRPIQVTFSVDGNTAYVTNYNDPQTVSGNLGTVSVIDVLSQTVTNTFDMGGSGSMGPMGAVVSPDGSKLWLTGTAGNTVHAHSLLSGDNYSYTATDGLRAAHGLDISADGKYLYTSVKSGVLSPNRDAVAVIDAATGAVVTTINTTGLTGGLSDATALHGLAYVAPVPVPAAVWLFGSGLIGLAGLAGRRKAA